MDSSTPQDDSATLDLLVEALAIQEEDGADALEAWLASKPDVAPMLRRRLGLLVDSGLAAHLTREPAERMPERLGEFELVRPLGGGGMGVVWLAKQDSLQREVALKLIRAEQLVFPGALTRFRREVETIAQLQHPGVVPVYAIGEERGLPYFAMEYVRGASVSEILATLSQDSAAAHDGASLLASLPSDSDATESALFEGSWDIVAARIAREVAEALEHVRRRGVVHRDVKPSNVMVTRSGRVLLVDFGLSARSSDERITRTGSAVGSLAYMAPELLSGDARPDDARQDVYSLGVTLYELLTLRPAFESEGEIAMARKVLAGELVPLSEARPDLDADLRAVVERAISVDPNARHATPGELAHDLSRFLDARPLLEPAPASESSRGVTRARAANWWLPLIAFGLASLALWLWIRAKRDAEAERVRAEQILEALEPAEQKALLERFPKRD